ELAGIGEPEPAVGLEDDVVRSGETPAVAAVVEHLDGPGGEVDALDPTAGPVAAGETAAVVADVQRAVRSEGGTVGPAVALRDHLDSAVEAHPGDGGGVDLGQDETAVG